MKSFKYGKKEVMFWPITGEVISQNKYDFPLLAVSAIITTNSIKRIKNEKN